MCGVGITCDIIIVSTHNVATMSLLSNQLFIAVTAAAIGAGLTALAQRIFGKRGLFTYNVWHNRVGITADDAVFGAVQVTWNGKPVANLYTSTVELRNESLRDYADVVARVYTSDAYLLTERTDLVDTTHVLAWTPEFTAKLTVPPGMQAQQWQHDLYDRQREYLIPVMNRGQVVRLTFLNVAKGEGTPSIWLDVVHTGVRLKFRIAPQLFLGVPQPAAVLAGTVLGAFVLWAIVSLVTSLWLAALLSMLYGLIVLLPGVALIRLWRSVRDTLAG